MKKLVFAAAFLMLLPSTSQAFSVNLVTDIHAGSSISCGDFVCVPSWQSAFQEFLDKTEGLIITVGDNTDQAKKNYAAQLRVMTSGREIYWANGNHDKKVYVGGSKHYIIDKEDWRIVLVDYKSCGQKDINWLKKTLKNYKDKKVAAVMHYPIFMPVNYNFKINKDCKKIEKVFRDYNVDYVFSGHRHGDNWTRVYNGVTYHALLGLTYGFGINYETIDLQ